MSHALTKSALGLALGFLLIGPASAAPFLPHADLGNFLTDDQVDTLDFSVATNSIVTIETVSYLGGGTVTDPSIAIPSGGFDPILTLFDDTGTVLAINDDIDFFGGDLDSRIETPLAAGTYSVAISQFGNFFNGGIGDNISNGFEIPFLPVSEDPAFFTGFFFDCSNGQFCDIFQDNRGSLYAVNFSAQAVSVPEPSSLALLGFGLVGAGLAYRRRQQN